MLKYYCTFYICVIAQILCTVCLRRKFERGHSECKQCPELFKESHYIKPQIYYHPLEAETYASPFVQLCRQRSPPLCASMRIWQLTAIHLQPAMRQSCGDQTSILAYYFVPGNIGWTCVPAARIAAIYAYRYICENMRRVSTRWWYQKYIDQVWHFMRLSIFRFHSP